MWIWISSALLASLIVSGLSFPHPDDKEYKIPEVGTGKRSQYYVLHSDGSFKYGFDDGEGGFESVKSHSVGSRNGKFGYVDPEGNTIRLEYEAGENGFVARGDHLPKPSPELAKALAAVIRSNKPFVDPLASSFSDASYGFKFDSEDHSRNEQSDADGTVTGSYSYVDENGVKRSFNYRAGKGIGFFIEGDGLIQEHRAPVTRTHQATRNQQGPGVRTRQRTSFGGIQREQYSSSRSGANLRSSSQAFADQQSPIASTRSKFPSDASYSFKYDAGDHSRSENADANLNVDGKYSFVADDGKERKVSYVAGASTGFIAEGDHLPKAPESQFGERVSSTAQRGSYSGHSTSNVRSNVDRSLKAPVQSHSAEITRGYTYQTRAGISHNQPASVRSSGTFNRQRGSQRHQSSSTFQRDDTPSPTLRTSVPSHRRVFEEANIRSSSRPQGPYSFSYDTSSHSRSEKGDENNNVDGRFAFVADDGKRREIRYEAGSDTGFIAEGAHIPVGPAVPGAPSGQPTGRIVPVPSVRFFDPLANSDSDASYKFEFDSETYSRRETADEDGNVLGTYTIVEDDGTRVTYRFRAGKGIGFEQTEISRTKGPKPSPPIPYSGPLAGDISATSQFPSVRQGQQGLLTPNTKFASQQDQAFAQRTPHYRESEGYVSPQTFSAQPQTQYGQPHTQSIQPHTHSVQPSYRTSQGTSSQSGFTSFDGTRSQFSPARSDQVFPGFVLHTYDQTPNSEKFGYVLKFDN